jgi:DNA-binding MurR/RpiR family transcriptional regulator
MADDPSFDARLRAEFDALSPQLQEAARWVIDNPAEVALLSTREQARRAGVTAATLTRLAQRLGMDGYEGVRRLYADAVRRRPDSYRGRAEELVARRTREGDAALVQDTFASVSQHLRDLAVPASVDALAAAADRIAAAERVYCLGLRASFSVAFIFHYIRTLFGSNSVLIEGPGATAVDVLRTVGTADVLLVVSVQPYVQHTIEVAKFARSRGAGVVAVTDSEVSPLVSLSDDVIMVRTETPSFFHTMTPAFAAVECLAALIAARRGEDAVAALQASEDQLSAFSTYLRSPGKGRRQT